MAQQLDKIIKGLTTLSIKGPTQIEIKGLCHDSRHYQEGQLFIAIRGTQFDGHLFVNEACNRGAPGVIVEDDRVVSSLYKGTIIKVKDSRKALDVLAANFFDNPSEKIFVVGVTGTNGKTTTTHMIEAVLNANGMGTAVMGTIDNHFRDKKKASTHTTPDALDLQEMLAYWRDEGAKAVSLEVSSHGLALARVDSIHFDACVFTNLTRDHLDFHKTTQEYIKAKARLFKEILKKSSKKSKRAILNIEDSHYKDMSTGETPLWTYGFKSGDFRAEDVSLSLGGTKFKAVTPQGSIDCELQMIGRHNILNALAAMAVGVHAGLKKEDIAKALKALSGVRGRLERVSSKKDLNVFVDYAHSDDALKNVLGFIKNLRDESQPTSRIITVFGCGGDRDKGKRPLMMKAAQSFSDLVVVTSDNPRTEDPQKIIDDIVQGDTDESRDKTLIEPDRRLAIKKAIEKANPQDIILIAGKGHEDYQIIGQKKHPFDDVLVAKEYLN